MGVFDVLLRNLKTLFVAREFVNGKVDLQKSFYFMKELGFAVPVDFRWSKLGPYSYELANLTERLTAQGYLQYTSRYSEQGFRRYELVERNFRFVESEVNERLRNFFDAMERVWNRNNFNQIDFIECAASLHFIYKNSHDKRKSVIFQKLGYLKPDRITAFEPLKEDAWNFLREQGLICDLNCH